MNVRAIRSGEIDAAVSVWREANIARGAPHGPQRTARIRAKLSAPDALRSSRSAQTSLAWRSPSPCEGFCDASSFYLAPM